MASVCYLSIGYVSPQYHLVFNELFETLSTTGNDALIDDIGNNLLDSDCDIYFYDAEFISDDPLVYHLPPLGRRHSRIYYFMTQVEFIAILIKIKQVDNNPDFV